MFLKNTGFYRKIQVCGLQNTGLYFQRLACLKRDPISPFKFLEWHSKYSTVTILTRLKLLSTAAFACHVYDWFTTLWGRVFSLSSCARARVRILGERLGFTVIVQVICTVWLRIAFALPYIFSCILSNSGTNYSNLLDRILCLQPSCTLITPFLFPTPFYLLDWGRKGLQATVVVLK